MDVFQKGSRFQCPWKSIHEGRGKKRETYLARVWTKRSGQGAHLWRFPRTSFQCQCKMKIKFSLAMKLSVLSGPAFPWVSIQQAFESSLCLGHDIRWWGTQILSSANVYRVSEAPGGGKEVRRTETDKKENSPWLSCSEGRKRPNYTPPHTHTQPLFRGSPKKCLMTVKIKRKEYLELRTLCAQGPMQS